MSHLQSLRHPLDSPAPGRALRWAILALVLTIVDSARTGLIAQYVGTTKEMSEENDKAILTHIDQVNQRVDGLQQEMADMRKAAEAPPPERMIREPDELEDARKAWSRPALGQLKPLGPREYAARLAVERALFFSPSRWRSWGRPSRAARRGRWRSGSTSPPRSTRPTSPS